MRNDKYILDASGEPVPEPNLFKWAAWIETAERKVTLTRFCGMKVSTVFLGLDHAFNSPVPVLWESMIFGGRLNCVMLRCAGSREQAEAMHREMLQRASAVGLVGGGWFQVQPRKRRRKMFRQAKRKLL
jgi:hypothetical protein